MAQVIVNLKKVQVFENEKSCDCNLVFNEKIHGYKREIDANGNISFVESDEVNYISMPKNAIIAQLKDINDAIAMYFSIHQTVGLKELNIALFKAVLTLERTSHVAGEVYGQDENGIDLAFSRDCITTTIVGVKISSYANDRMEAAML